jgi:hypothetical protein
LALPRSENRKRALDLGTAESAFEMQIQSGVAEDCPDRLLAALAVCAMSVSTTCWRMKLGADPL